MNILFLEVNLWDFVVTTAEEEGNFAVVIIDLGTGKRLSVVVIMMMEESVDLQALQALQAPRVHEVHKVHKVPKE
ncbi:hypothetical protein M1E11_13900 [Bacillus sp. JZ8]